MDNFEWTAGVRQPLRVGLRGLQDAEAHADIRCSAKFTVTGKTHSIMGKDRAFLSVATVGS
jgi:hypothetical protein